MKDYMAAEIAAAESEREIKRLVRHLYLDDRHRHAIRLIAQHRPTTQQLFRAIQVTVDRALQGKPSVYEALLASSI